MAVAADDDHARQAGALLRADDVDDALPDVVERNEGYAELGDIGDEGRDLQTALRVGDLLIPVGGRHVVVWHGERRIRTAHLAAIDPKALEGLRARDLMHQMAVDIDKVRVTRERVDQMRVPDLVKQRSGPGGDPAGGDRLRGHVGLRP